MSRGVKLFFFLLFEIFNYSTCNFVVYESSDNPVSLPAGSVQIHIFYHIFFFFYIIVLLSDKSPEVLSWKIGLKYA